MGVIWSNCNNLLIVQMCVWVSAILYELVCGHVSVHHRYTSRVQSNVLKAATKGVFLVSCVCGVVVTNNLPPELMQDVVVLHLHPPPLLGNVAAALHIHSLLIISLSYLNINQ